MRNITKIARHSLRNLGSVATKRVIKQFANKYQLVYFGHVDPQEDEYELVRGLTVSTTHTDNHYSVGSYNGHDIILLERQNTLTFPGKKDTSYRWLILQVDLKHSGLPHVFIDTKHHDIMFYANAFIARGGMQDVSSYFTHVSQTFAEKCKVFAPPIEYARVRQMLQPKIAETIARHFSGFDYEFFEDRVLVYASNHVPTPALLDDMLRIGAWLAEELNVVVQQE